MNLVDHAWIPVMGTDGKSRQASLADIFRDGEDIADVAANPCQRIALMRLLICIAQAALDGPEDEADWLQCRSRLVPDALTYLTRWHDRFNLFGDHAFLQVDGLEIPDESFIKPPTTLDATSKNGGTGLSELWDHISDARVFQDTDTDLPLSLLCYVNFSCSGKIGKAQWRGTLFNGSTAAGPSHNYLHTYILGSCITDTIHQNLVPKDVVATSVVMGSPNKWGRPIWEQMPSTPDDDDAVRNAATTYLGRLVPLSRLVKFDNSPSRAVTCTIGPPPEGLKMTRLPTLREPAATVIWRAPDNSGYLLARAGRHVWRDLEAIFAVHRESGTLSLEPFLRHFVYPQAIEGFRVWIGGSVRGKNEGKYDDLVEWSAFFKSSYFGDRSLAGYAAGITLAEFGKNCLFKAMNKYHKPNPDLPGTEKRQIPYRIAESIFWNTLDQHVDALFDLLETNTKASSQKWDNCIHSALRSAYDQCCPHETPRQIEAYVQGRKILDGWKGEKNAA